MKKILVSILISIFIISMVITVNAATGSISLSSSSETVTKGNTFKVTLAGTADENITGFQSTLSYDTTKLSIESKSAGSNFSEASGSDSEIAILSSGSTVEKSGTLYTITFKVLDNAEEGETTITVSGATLALVNDSSTQEDTTAADESLTINIKTDDTTAGTENSIPSNSSSNNASSSSTTNTKVASTKLPQTGVEVVSLIAVIALSAVSIVSYVSYKKYKNI